ncbi:butyrophilin subfamily 3 member A2-like [Myripristis murdjan]|uniref:butyrophilin subfamily 3 member A2-like n=1 Tax=Myripristis murdjan TaxID=586833 RepID=UPI0011761145|nr:butyrophilin subfamily 3 member A2-like [Myripristis murdjan]
MLGDDVILPSHLEPAMAVVGRTVEWTRPDLNPQFVHTWREGLELLIDHHPSYKGRTSLLMAKLKDGDVSLKLSEVKLSDEGKYRCFIPSLGKETTVQLIVGFVSSPFIAINKSSSGVVLECESKGWYPEPELFWLDAEGKLLSAGAPETVRGPDGLYTVSSRVTVEKSHSNSFTCRVQQSKIQQTRLMRIHLEDGVFMDKSNCSAAHITTGFAVVLLCVVVVVFSVYLWRTNKLGNTRMGRLTNIFSKKQTQQREELNNLGQEGPTDEERERQKLMAEKEVKKNAKHEEEQKKENERKQKEELEKQIKQLESELKEVKKSEETERKLKEDAEKMKHEYKDLLKKSNLVLMNRRSELEMKLKRTKEKSMKSDKKEEKVKAVIEALKETKMMIDEVQKRF